MSNEALKDLHTALLDARTGYASAIPKAENPETSALLKSIDELHARAHADVHAALTSVGETADEDGSFMGTVHKAAIAVRSVVSGIDEGSLSAFASGEENNLELYDEAIRMQPDKRLAGRLHEHRQKLAAKIVVLKQISAAA